MHRRGFTLIELLVVISIITLLSTVVIAAVSQARSRARDTQRIRDLIEVQKALELYYTTNGRYPVVVPINAPAGSMTGTHAISCWDCSYNDNTNSGSRFNGYSNGDWDNNTNHNNQRLAAIASYLVTRPKDPLAPTGGFSNSQGYWYMVSSSGKDYKLIDVCGAENSSSIPAKMKENPPSPYAFACNNYGISIYSSARSQAWSLNCPFASTNDPSCVIYNNNDFDP